MTWHIVMIIIWWGWAILWVLDYAPFMSFVLATLVMLLYCWFNRYQLLFDFLDYWASRSDKLDNPKDPHWEVVPNVEKMGLGIFKVIGYQVRWSEPDEQGKYLWVGHYFAGGAPGSSVQVCQHMADRHAARLNEERKGPWQYPEWARD